MKKKIIIIGTCLLIFIGAGIAISQPGPISPFILRFIDLIDTPSSLTGNTLKYVRVNAGETDLEFAAIAGGGDLLSDGSVPMTANWDIGNFDITLKSLTGDGSLDFGGGASTELVNSAAPTTDAAGEIALDTTITDHQPLWQYYDGGENMTIIAIDTAELPALDNEIVKYDAATDKFVLEADASAAFDSTAVDDTTWSDGANAANVWTFDVSGTDHTMTIGNGILTFSHAVTVMGALTGTLTGNADTATVGTTVTITDNENTAENNPIVFVENGDLDGGNLGLESDGDLYYTPSTGVVTATGFAGALTGNVTGDVSGNAGTVTNGVYTTDNISALAATTSAQLYGVLSDETGSAAGAPLAVFNQAPTIDSPTFTTAITATDLIDSAHYVADSIDNEHINWADIDNLGDEGALVVADTADATSFPALFESATGTLAIKTDAGLTYDASTANLSATTFTGALAGNATTATTASAGDAAVDFFGAGVDAVTDTTTCTDLEGTGLSIAAGVLNWSAASTDLTDTADLLYEAELDDFSELQAQIADKTLVNTADGAVWLGNHDFGGADLELPQASPAVPDADGEIELDFTDGKMVVQHGSAHAELGSSTDVAMASLIHSFSGTIFQPDTVNDVITVKAINSIEFPHGIVITAVYLGIASDTTYTLTVQNFDDFDTINGANPTIDAVTYTADTTGEIIDTTPTYATIAAGQIIMISIPATDVDWIHFEIYYYEPAA